MAFDGIITRACVKELSSRLDGAKVVKIAQPGAEEIVLTLRTGGEKLRLYASCDSSSACVRLTEMNPENPDEPYPFCMLLRKHLSGSKLIKIEQRNCERIIEFTFERLNELGLMVSKKLIFEIMGKHSNIILISAFDDRTIFGSIKGVPSGINRAREILPGRPYIYPPVQEKIPFDKVTADDLAPMETEKEVLSGVGGISPSIAYEIAEKSDGADKKALIDDLIASIDSGSISPRVYVDSAGAPLEYHITSLSMYEGCDIKTFDDLMKAMEWYYENRRETSRLLQRKNALIRPVKAAIEKAELKKQRLLEDLLRAENAEKMKLYGELLTANINSIPGGAREARVTNYYTGEEVTIPLDPRKDPGDNAQHYFKRYRKSKTAAVEKKSQLEDTETNIEYLGSVLASIEQAKKAGDLTDIRSEIEDSGIIKRSGQKKFKKTKKQKAEPKEYVTSDGFTVLVGRNNRENDILTLEIADKGDYWLHTKDIPGSHVILRARGKEPTETAILEAASLAALNSKASTSENVPVDYVPVRFVKKPSGAKPGMVIFTHNRTVFVDPKEPKTFKP